MKNFYNLIPTNCEVDYLHNLLLVTCMPPKGKILKCIEEISSETLNSFIKKALLFSYAFELFHLSGKLTTEYEI